MAKKYKPKKSENIGHRQGDEITITIDDPDFKPCGINATRPASAIMNSKGNPIMLLHKKGHIDHYQKLAADEFMKMWDILNVGLGMGIDYSRTKVDGGNYNQGLSLSVMEAANQMRDIRRKLGDVGYDLLCKVVGKGQSIAYIFEHESQRVREYKSSQLRECLDTLAIFWGYKNIDYVKSPINDKKENNEKKSHLRKIHPFNA